MTDGNLLKKRIIKELRGTRKKLSDVCEDLGVDYDELVTSGNLGIDQCTHCGRWEFKLIPDLDNNPICTYCRDIEGM